MNCLQKICLSTATYSPPHSRCLLALQVALGIITACALSLSIGAIVSFFPPSVGYAGGAIAAAALFGLAVSLIKGSSTKNRVRDKEPSSHSEDISLKPAGTENENIPTYANDFPTMGNFEMPNEILLNILSHLTPKELVLMGLTSKTWRAFTHENILWAKHCDRSLIPLTKNLEGAEAYAKQFAQVQNLTSAIMAQQVQPKSFCFDQSVFFTLINNNKIFLLCEDGVHIFNKTFANLEKKISFDFSEHGVPNRLELIDNILFCFHFPNPQGTRQGVLFSYDLKRNVPIKDGVIISLREWERRPSKYHGGRLAFAKDRAFCNYANGDIRVWNLEDESNEYRDDIEYKDYGKHLKMFKETYGADSEKYKESATNVEWLMKLQEKLKKERKILQGHTGPITHLFVSGDHLYSSSKDGTIKIWNLNTNTCIQTIVTDLARSTHDTALGVDHFLVNGNYVFGYMYDYNVKHTFCKVWDTQTGLCLQTIELDTRMDSCCLYGNLLFYSRGTTIHIYDLSTRCEMRTFNCEIPNRSLDVSVLAHLQLADGKLICIGKRDQLYHSGNHVFVFEFSSKL
jgi:hypothetical protein